jgi:hypothetical protein
MALDCSQPRSFQIGNIEAAKIGAGAIRNEATMANDVIDFKSRRAAREAEHAEYDAHHRRVVAIFEMMSPVIACAQELGADNQAIASALRAIVEELEAVQCGSPDAAS